MVVGVSVLAGLDDPLVDPALPDVAPEGAGPDQTVLACRIEQLESEAGIRGEIPGGIGRWRRRIGVDEEGAAKGWAPVGAVVFVDEKWRVGRHFGQVGHDHLVPAYRGD